MQPQLKLPGQANLNTAEADELAYVMASDKTQARAGLQSREKPDLVSFAALAVSRQTGEVGAAVRAVGGILLTSLPRQDKQQHNGTMGARRR